MSRADKIRVGVKQPMEKKGLVTKPQVPDKTSIDQVVDVVKGLMGRIVEKLWKI